MMGGQMEVSLADLAVDHATAIDLIDLSMRSARRARSDECGCPDPAELAEWMRLYRIMRERNSDVVMFLIRIIADQAVLGWPEPEVFLRALRSAAAMRMDAAEKAMEDLGYTP